jgi:hypothetical protein
VSAAAIALLALLSQSPPLAQPATTDTPLAAGVHLSPGQAAPADGVFLPTTDAITLAETCQTTGLEAQKAQTAMTAPSAGWRPSTFVWVGTAVLALAGGFFVGRAVR